MPQQQDRQIKRYKDVLAEAHQKYTKGLNIQVELMQYPSEENKNVAVSRATVVGFRDDGIEERWVEYGDAASFNVTRMIVPHIIRMAGTRAKARALKDAIGEGEAVEEEFGEGGADPAPYNQPRESRTPTPPPRENRTPTPSNNDNPKASEPNSDAKPVTDAQLRYIEALIEQVGTTKEDVEKEFGALDELSAPKANNVARALADRRA